MSDRLRPLKWIALSLVTLTLIACGHGAAVAPIETDPSAPSLSSEMARGLVDQISEQVAQIRGLEFKEPVPVRVVDDAELRKYMLRRLDAFGQRQQLERTGRVYQLLGLIPEEIDLLETVLDVLEEQVGGFYDPTEGAYFLMADIPGASAPVYTAHELTHALEDQHYDLDGRIRVVIEDDDQSFAVGAVHEGSATLLMSAYMVGAMQRGELDAQALMDVSQSEAGKLQQIQEMPELLQRQLLGPYLLGALFLAKGNMVGAAMNFPREDVDAVMQSGPTSSEQILHPEKFWERLDPPQAVSIKPLGSVLGDDWGLDGEGVIGELGLGPLVGAKTPLSAASMGTPRAADWTNEAAAGWGGDRWQLWRIGDEFALVWLTLWDSPQDAEEFASALGRHTPLAYRLLGSEVAVVAGEIGEAEQRLLGRILE